MEPTPNNAPSSDVEHVRKVYAKDVKNGSTLNTVFRVTDKERHTARSGKTFLSFTLVDKTGTLEARIFDNVDAAEAAFANDDYLLVSGKVSAFHGKPQLVVDKLERLDAGPMDVQEFTFTPPPSSAPPAEPGQRMSKHVRQRLISLLDDPAVSSGLEALVRHLERYIDDRIAEKSGEPRKAPKPAPRVEHRPKMDEREHHKEKKEAPARDHGLPKDLAFKPFNAIAPPSDGKPEEQKPAEGPGSSNES